MRRGLIIATGLFLMCATSAGATPVPDVALNEIYTSCVRSMEQNAPNAAPEMRAGYCSCVRGEFQRSFTLESLTALEARIRSNSQTMQDIDERETMQRTCAARVQQATTQPQVSTPQPPPPRATPAPQPIAPPPAPAAPIQPQGAQLTDAELDVEQRDCLASMERSSPPNVTAEMRQRFCGCAREWMRTTLTRETLAGLNDRQRRNATTMQDREQMEGVMRMCIARAQQAGPATLPARPLATPIRSTAQPPAPPQAARPAPIAPAAYGHPGAKLSLR